MKFTENTVSKMTESDLFKALFDVIPYNIYLADIESYEILYMNKQMIKQRGNLVGRKCYKSVYGEQKPCYFCKIPDLIDDERKPNNKMMVFECFNPADDNWYQLHEKAISWPDGKTVKYGIAVNISELKETQNRLAEAHAQLTLKNKELERLSTIDHLTETYNRSKIDETIRAEVNRARRYQRVLSIIMIDIDHFKEVNDLHGHHTGDLVLKQLVNIFQKNIRSTDALGRWGGEEFLIVCPETTLANAHVMAEKLRQKVEKFNFPNVGQKTASFGVAGLVPEDDVDSLLRRADQSLYLAKNNGRNRVENIL